MRAGARRLTGIAAAIALVGGVAACGSDSDDSAGETAAPVATAPDAVVTETTAPETPPPNEQQFEPEAAAEAAPEAAPEGERETAELPEDEEQAVRALADAYVTGLNRGDGQAVCRVFDPDGLPLSELPVRRGGCGPSLTASIGHRRPGGAPAWKRTEIAEVTAVSVGEDRARVTATVTHRFADRKYTSVEEDVIYLDRDGDRWLVAKPSATLYRAVGYPEPPLRAFTPPE